MTRSLKERLASFFSGKLYPALLAVLVVLGHTFAIEFYLNIFLLVSACAALLLCDDVRPLAYPIVAFLYQIPVVHSPAAPVFSQYYFTSWRLPVVLALGVLVAFSLVFFFVRHSRGKWSFRHTPLLLPLILLSLALLCNGLFSPHYTVADLILGALEPVSFFFCFYLFFFGISEKENTEDLASWLSYITALLSLTLLCELAVLYLSSGSPVTDGALVKERVLLGWGIWNSLGVSLTVLIPMNFYGVFRGKHPVLSFLLATATFAGAALSLSRGALLCGALVYLGCLLLACVRAPKKTVFRVGVLIGTALLLAGTVLLREKIAELLSRGLGDNGRFDLWKNGLAAFLSAPVFGAGFFDVGADTFPVVSFMPGFSHNTLVELLAATGIFGFLAYGYYRVRSLMPIFRRPTVENLLCFFSLAALLLGSLLDNFVFYFYPLTYYNLVLAVLHRRETGTTENNERSP